MQRMQKPSFDPGLTQQYNGVLKRAVNRDGRFNVRRTGATWHDAHPYLFLINASWPRFLLLVLLAFIVVNSLFAAAYALIGFDNVKGTEAATPFLQFVNTFFFSAHTLTTVGYGNMWPVGAAANTVAALEALTGLMLFAIATGLLFGRFSRPSARIGFSPKMLIAPYSDVTALQFRVVNRRSNNLINLKTRVLMMTVEIADGKPIRQFKPLDLERESVLFLALTWTVVHPIDQKSPLFGMTAEQMAQRQVEFIVVLEGFDESFGQIVHTRYSYRHDEIIWGAKFTSSFVVEQSGDLMLEIDRVGEYESAMLEVEK